MTDRELLELAAKAAKVEIFFDTDGDSYRIKASGNRQYWNPLDNDGDALRLAVKLGLDVCIDTPHENDAHTHVVGFPSEHTAELLSEIEYHHNDPYAATRRAIVRAAAEIGRGMKC